MYPNKVKKKSIRRKLSRYNRNKLSNKRKSKRTNKKIKSRRSYNKRKLQRGGGDTSIPTLLSQLGLDAKYYGNIVHAGGRDRETPILGIEDLQKLDGEGVHSESERPSVDFLMAKGGLTEEESYRMITALRSGIHNLLEVVLPQTDPADIEARILEVENALADPEPPHRPIVNIKGLYEFKARGGNFESFGMTTEESGRLMEELECPMLHEHLLYTSPLRENLAAYSRGEDVLLRKGDVYEGITVVKDSTLGGADVRATHHSGNKPPEHHLKCDFCRKSYSIWQYQVNPDVIRLREQPPVPNQKDHFFVRN